MQVGSKTSLRLNSKQTVWKLDDTVEEAWSGKNDEEIIDSDMLLDEDDLKRPDQQSLRGKNIYSYIYFYKYILFKY